MTAPVRLPRPTNVADRQDVDWTQVEHIVLDEDPDRALCGVDQSGVPWDQGLPVCVACYEVARGGMN
jgi:hypothetical protein